MKAAAKASASVSWKLSGRLAGEGYPPQDTLVIQTGLVAQGEVPKFGSRCKALDAHWSPRRHQDAGRWIVQVCSKQALKRTEQKRQIDCEDRAERIDASALRFDDFSAAELAVQPGSRHRTRPDRARIIRRHL
ncbi:MAG: hypothetical protein M3178_18395 [Pseudomonadota bacterium]|nr:hypothetical protein [Pseudomonadota bacterium]